MGTDRQDAVRSGQIDGGGVGHRWLPSAGRASVSGISSMLRARGHHRGRADGGHPRMSRHRPGVLALCEVARVDLWLVQVRLMTTLRAPVSAAWANVS